MITPVIHHFMKCKTKVTLIIPEWRSAHFWPVIKRICRFCDRFQIPVQNGKHDYSRFRAVGDLQITQVSISGKPKLQHASFKDRILKVIMLIVI